MKEIVLPHARCGSFATTVGRSVLCPKCYDICSRHSLAESVNAWNNMQRQMTDKTKLSEFDKGFIAGRDLAVQEAITIINSHIDRLDPGKQNSVRSALTDLECSMRSILIAQKNT